jgi:hypothetical protein
MRSLRVKGQPRTHFRKESDRRRRLVLSAIAELNLSHFIVTSPISVGLNQARERCLSELIAELVRNGIKNIELESDESKNPKDRRILSEILRSLPSESVFDFNHELPNDEPLLWIPDAIAWSTNRGGDWERRVRQMDVKAQNLS